MRCLEIFLLAASAFFGAILLLLLIVPNRNNGDLAEKTHKIRPKYRPDYYYSKEADAFYKIHLERNYFFSAGRTCDRDSAKLISSNAHDLMIARRLYEDKIGRTGDTISFVDDDDVLIVENCTALDTSGQLIKKNCYSDADSVVCKIEANTVQYDDRCKMFFTSNKTRYTPNDTLGSCYFMPHFSLTWQEAEDRCELDGGHLVVINSQQEADFLTDFVRDNNHNAVAHSHNSAYLAIGFSFSHTEDGKRVFTSVFGRSLAEEGYETWSPGEPNNVDGREDCGSWYADQPGLNDAFCGLVWGFVCEKEMHCGCCTPTCLSKQ